jgi:hypothetical protein
MFYDALGDWTYLNESPARIQAVTAEDVQRVAKLYFPAEGRNVMWYHRKAGSEEDPELAALEGQAKAFAKQAIGQIAQVEDAGQLQQMLAQVQAGITQAPAEVRPALELIAKRVQARLAELAGGEE